MLVNGFNNSVKIFILLWLMSGLHASCVMPCEQQLEESSVVYSVIPIKDLITIAQNGNSNAAYELGNIYYSGLNGQKNYDEALKWFELAIRNSCEYKQREKK